MRLRMGGLRALQTGTAKASLRRDLPGEEGHQDRAQALPYPPNIEVVYPVL